MPALDRDDLDPVSLDPADLDPDLDPVDLDPADLDGDVISGAGPLGIDDLEADPADVAEQRLDVPVDDDDPA